MFEVMFTRSALGDIRFFRKTDQNVIYDAVARQLVNEALIESRNRKPLRTNDFSAWEMRVGAYRVFYDVDKPTSRVIVKAVGRKEHNKLFIRGQEYKL